MRETGIIFTGGNPAAILDGRKTQTRRIITPALPDGRHSPFLGADGIWRWMTGVVSYVDDERRCRYGGAGDRLWMREAWKHGTAPNDYGEGMAGFADGDFRMHPKEPKGGEHWCREWRNKSPMYMPRWASRATLEIVQLRPERLQDITEEDAKAEGVEPAPGHGVYPSKHAARVPSYREGYRLLWAKLHGARSWDLNPWTWAIHFRPLKAT